MSITPYHRNQPQGFTNADLTPQDRKRHRYADLKPIPSDSPTAHRTGKHAGNPGTPGSQPSNDPGASPDSPEQPEISRLGRTDRTPHPEPLRKTLRADPPRPSVRSALANPTAPSASSLTNARALAILATRSLQVGLCLTFGYVGLWALMAALQASQ